MKDDPEAVFDSFQEIFADLFGSRTTRDLALPLVVTLAEAANGAERTVELSRATSCRACGGKGGAPGATYQACVKCAGRGGERRTEGFLLFTATCDGCHGAGGRWTTACSTCEGRRETRKTKKVRVTIPAGVVAGHVLRLAGQGNDLGKGPGDALLTIEIAPHPTLRREGDDLHARVRLDDELVRTGEARVAWLEGSARVRVPSGATHGTETRLRGWGCVRFGAPYAPPPSDESPYRSSALPARGDLVVTFVTRDEERDEDAGDLDDARAAPSRDPRPAAAEHTPPLFALGAALFAIAALAAAWLLR